MKLPVYCIRDNASGFLAPFTELNDAVALRNYKLLLSKPDTVYNFKSEDFSLYKIAVFDTDSGSIEVFPLEVIA